MNKYYKTRITYAIPIKSMITIVELKSRKHVTTLRILEHKLNLRTPNNIVIQGGRSLDLMNLKKKKFSIYEEKI